MDLSWCDNIPTVSWASCILSTKGNNGSKIIENAGSRNDNLSSFTTYHTSCFWKNNKTVDIVSGSTNQFLDSKLFLTVFHYHRKFLG